MGLLQDDTIDQAFKTRLENALNIATKLKFQSVPKEVIELLAQHPNYSLYYAEGLKYKNIPEIIIKSIAKDPFLCARFYDSAIDEHKIAIKDIPYPIKRGYLIFRKIKKPEELAVESFSSKLSKIFTEAIEVKKLVKFLDDNGFEYRNGKYYYQSETEHIMNINQSYGIEVLTIGGKFRINFHSEDHMRDFVTPIEAENQEMAIEIVRNLLEKTKSVKYPKGNIVQ